MAELADAADLKSVVLMTCEFESHWGHLFVFSSELDIRNENNMYTADRNREIFALKESGRTYSQIGIQFGLSKERVRQIYLREKENIEKENSHVNAVEGNVPYTFYDAIMDVCENSKQATRIFKCLNRAGIINVIENHNGSLDSYSDESLMAIRNFGTISLVFARRANRQYKKKLGI